MTGNTAKAIDQKNDFRDAMRRFAATVSIVTASDGTRSHGMTATSVTSLSFDPPSLLVCVNRSTLMHGILAQATHFCVNVLHREQQALSTVFSGAVPAAQRFAYGGWVESEEGLPYLPEAQANLFCRKVISIPFGTHMIEIGEVERVCMRDSIAPLVYQNAVYCFAAPANQELYAGYGNRSDANAQ